MQLLKRLFALILAATALFLGMPHAFADSVPAEWTCNGSCGSLSANGVVGLSPAGAQTYNYVTTANGSTGVGVLPTGRLGQETNGSTLSTGLFWAGAGTTLSFNFDFVTSDGAGFADYAWAALIDSSQQTVALLFTARTEASGTIVPGTGMPSPTATLTPTTVPIIANATSWSPLGSDSGTCYDLGCGSTGWIQSQYVIQNAGTYSLEIGVTNWGDTGYNTGLALDGLMVGSNPITPTPEPSCLILVSSALLGTGTLLRRRQQDR